jgi:hypothetical protein
VRCNGATATTEPSLRISDGFRACVRHGSIFSVSCTAAARGCGYSTDALLRPTGEHSGAQPMPEGVPYRPLAKRQSRPHGVGYSGVLHSARRRARAAANGKRCCAAPSGPRPPRCHAGMCLAPLGQRAARCPLRANRAGGRVLQGYYSTHSARPSWRPSAWNSFASAGRTSGSCFSCRGQPALRAPRGGRGAEYSIVPCRRCRLAGAPRSLRFHAARCELRGCSCGAAMSHQSAAAVARSTQSTQSTRDGMGWVQYYRVQQVADKLELCVRRVRVE